MSIYLLVLAAFAAGLLCVAGVVMVAGLWNAISKEAAERLACQAQGEAERQKLFEQVEGMRVELEALKQAGPKRYTHSTTAGLEDALAIAIDVITEYAASRQYTEARIGQLRGALAKLREGPYAYNPEKQAGQRPAKRDGGSGGDV